MRPAFAGVLASLAILTMLFVFSEDVQAHPGGTDGSGCHTCRTNCTARWGISYGFYHRHSPVRPCYASNPTPASPSAPQPVPAAPTPAAAPTPRAPPGDGIAKDVEIGVPDDGDGVGLLGVVSVGLAGTLLGAGGVWAWRKRATSSASLGRTTSLSGRRQGDEPMDQFQPPPADRCVVCDGPMDEYDMCRWHGFKGRRE